MLISCLYVNHIKKNNTDLSSYVIWEIMEVVNSNGGAAAEKASACESGPIARPGGAIPGAQVGGGANALRWAMWVS